VSRSHLRLVRSTNPNAPPPTEEELARLELLRHLPGVLRHAQGDNVTEMYLEAVKDYLDEVSKRLEAMAMYPAAANFPNATPIAASDFICAPSYNDVFWSRCEFIEEPEALLRGNAEKCRRELDGLMEEVKLLTTRLAVPLSPGLGTGGEVAALALRTSEPTETYKTALVKAKDETLPELFKRIEEKSEECKHWLSAQIIPMKAEARALTPVIRRIEDRIFSVELYAGLCETVTCIKDGKPAELTEPVHLFQRRLCMDEECLANYDVGGMEFKDLRAFDRWLCRKDNLDRVLPFPRTVVAFRVRRNDKEREIANFKEFIRFLGAKELDKRTFLYIRNGAQVHRLSTEIDFGQKLFPDADHPVLSVGEGRLYAKGHGENFKVIGENEYRAMVESDEAKEREYRRKVAEENKKPKADRQWVSSFSFFDCAANGYEPFTRESVQYDDIARRIARQMEQHNRVVLVLQGLLDRSPALHPHPPWRLYDAAGFGQALRLHRDSDRVLVAGGKPDFEAYRARVNALIGVGTVTIGQEVAWERFEAMKENARRNSDSRWNRVEWRPDRFRPEGDPGPGRFARVARLDKGGRVHFRWTKERRGGGAPVGRTYACKVGRVLNVDGYQAGDYKLFFADPRTRQEYLQWAPLLLSAEEYKAGLHGEAAPLAAIPKPAPKPPTLGRSAYARRKADQALCGKAVRLVRPITTQGGITYKKGSLWRVTFLSRGTFAIDGIHKDGSEEDGSGETDTRTIRCVSRHDFVLATEVADDPKYVLKPTKREPVRDEEDEDG
jgi:hypothetical protein